MSSNEQALRVALAAAEQLPSKLQRQLVERLMAATTPGKNTVVLYLQRLTSRKEARLAALMDKNNDGRLSPAEKAELQQLGSEVDRMLLANSHALAHTLRPELFDDRGRPIRRRFRQAIGRSSRQPTRPKPRNGRH